MTYLEFVSNVKLWLSGTTDILYIKELLEDEIELPINESGINQFPAAFLTPIPITIDENNMATYGIRVCLAGDVGLSPIMNPPLQTMSKRYITYSSLVTIFHKFIQQIPNNFNGIQFPITGNPIVLWDSQVDGLYFDVNFKTGVECY